MSAGPQKSQFSLLQERRFGPFFWTQFLGAGNDNLLKFAFTILVTYHTALYGGGDPKTTAFLIGAVFIAPYVLFSATSGQLADKMEKSRLIRLIKSLEIVIMLVAAGGFVFHQVGLLYAATFLMGLHSTVFGPVKYAYLPQHLAADELVGGNGLVEMGTFVSILIGTMVGGVLAAIEGSGPVYVAVCCVLVAVAGRIVAGRIPESPSGVPDLKVNWNPFSETWNNLKLARGNRTVFLSMLGISWLWFFGATFLTSFSPFAKEVLGGKVCIGGNVPASLILTGTVDDVRGYCKDLIDNVAPGGGYVMAFGTAMDEGKPDTVRAMVQFTKEYGVYR